MYWYFNTIYGKSIKPINHLINCVKKKKTITRPKSPSSRGSLTIVEIFLGKYRKDGFQIESAFFFEPICEKRARKKRPVARGSGWHTAAPFPKCVTFIKVTLIGVHGHVHTYSRRVHAKFGRTEVERGCINLIKARILPSTERRWAHVKIIFKAPCPQE